MKIKIKNIIIICILAVITNACEDDFLTISSKSSLTTATYFTTEADFNAAVTGIYTAMRGCFNVVNANDQAGFQTPNPLIIGDQHSDNARYRVNPVFNTNKIIADFVPDITTFSNHWNNFYDWIARTNSVIASIDNATFNQAEKDDLKGQALFLRAYSYWWLVRLYGDVCLHLTPVLSIEDASLPLSSEETVFEQIITDATTASSLLKTKASQTSGKVTSGAAKMLLADVFLWLERWEDAEDILDGIESEYSLMPEYSDVTDPAKKNNAESIFEIQFSSQSPQYSNSTSYWFIPRPLNIDTLAALTGVSNPQSFTSSSCGGLPTPDLIALYEPGDKRYDASIGYTTDADGYLLPICIKYLHKHALYGQADENMPVYRYAETLLFLAESINEQGGRPEEALGYLNQVRYRADLEDSPAVSQEEIREAIMKERQVELAFEGKRWFDLVRTGTAVDVITAYGERVKANKEAYYMRAEDLLLPTSFTNIVTKFEIPDQEKRLNPYID